MEHFRRSPRQPGEIANNHRPGAADVQQRHHRHQHRRNICNAADAAKQDNERQRRRCQPRFGPGQRERGEKRIGQRAGLSHGPHRKGHQQGKEGVEPSHGLSNHAQPGFHHRHGPAPAGTVRCAAAVFDRQHTFREL